MLKFCRTLLFCLLPLSFSLSSRAQLVISEFLADNETGLMDEDRERSDWIEIYNPTANPIDLAGWSLTDDPEDLGKWKFPSVTIPENGYTVVFASGKNRATAGKQLHANFSLSAGGEYLALVKPDGKSVSFEFSPEFPQQNPNISYGLAAGSLTELRFFTTPTPGNLNTAGFSDLSVEPIFLTPAGVYTNTVTVALKASQPNAVIRYVVGSNDVTASSTIYTAPLNFTSTTVVRAKAFVPGLTPSATVTRTFIVLGSDLFNFSSRLPILVLSTFGKAPSESSPIKVSAALFGTNGTRAYLNSKPDVDVRGQIKIRGSSSTQFPKKSFAFEIQDELGLDRKVSLLGMPKESDWVLYAPYTDKTLMRDVLAYEWSNMIGRYAPRTRFIEVYLDQNGNKLTESDYIGVYVLIEKIKRDDKRVDIAELLPSQNTQPEVTGGYIWKKDRLDPGDSGFSTSRAGTFGYVEPKEQQITSSQRTYLNSYLSQFETALYGSAFTNKLYANFYDVGAGIDHHLLVETAKNIDGYRLSTFIHKDRLGKITMGPIWDYNLSIGNANYNDGWKTDGWYYPFAGDYPWYGRLFQDADFTQAYRDRWAEIRRGPFVTTNLLSRIMQITDVLSEPATHNYSKWRILGQYVWPNPDGYQSRTTFRAEVNWMTNWLAGRLNWIDSQFVRLVQLSEAPGMVARGTTVTMTTPTYPIYFTTDGSDPRLPGGAISPRATRYTAPVAITGNTRIVARAKTASNWSAPTDATYIVDAPKVTITEIMYNPENAGTNDYEFIELKNVGSTPINLNGYRLSGGIDFVFTNSVWTNLAPGGLVVLAADASSFSARYPNVTNLAGQYTNSLDNSGERIVLEGPMREPILDFSYNDTWYPITDGYGFSLVIRDDQGPFPAWGNKEAYRASSNLGGSPGQDDPAPVSAPSVYISEILTHTDAPAVDAIELFNSGPADVDIGGWFLSDDSGTPRKFKVTANTTLRAGSYVVFTEADFNADPTSPNSFALSSLGDEVYLFSADAAGNLTGTMDGFSYGAAANGVSFGRHTTSDGKIYYPAQREPTLGRPNSGPAIGPVIINEIRYAATPYLPEFVELKNVTGQEVKLYDPAHPENTWRLNGLDFSFPTNVTLAPGGLALIVQNDPERFRASNNIPASVQIFGPFGGELQDNGENLELQRPDEPEQVSANSFKVPMIVVDAVRYNDLAPWPAGLVGTAGSIERISQAEFGGEPKNWRAALAASPGLEDIGWESWRSLNFTAEELNNSGVSGSFADPDADGQNNRDEYLCGTNPKSASSVLRLTIDQSGPLALSFEAIAGRSYTLYYRPTLAGGAWSIAGVYPAEASGKIVQISDPQPGFYRIATP